MKVLSIKPPWCFAIIYGDKNVENRSWNTTYRGRFFVHCSATPDKNAPPEVWKWVPEGAQYGGIIGSVEVTDVVDHYPGNKWFQGPKGFILENPKPEEFKPLKGRLGFFDL